MKTVTTSTGFEIDIDEARLNNMELFDAVAELQGGNKLALSRVLALLLGDDKTRLYDHVRKDGRVPVEDVDREVAELFEALGAKN